MIATLEEKCREQQRLPEAPSLSVTFPARMVGGVEGVRGTGGEGADGAMSLMSYARAIVSPFN